MQKFSVIKVITNHYRVEVTANTPEEALLKAYQNDHNPGELDSSYGDGEVIRPWDWEVLDSNDRTVNGIDRSVLRSIS